MKKWRLIAVVLLIFFTPAIADAVKYVEFYKGLPDYDKQKIFTVTTPELHQELRNTIIQIKTNNTQCNIGEVTVDDDWKINLTSNVCDSISYQKVKSIISQIAPSLKPEKTTVWIINLDTNKEPDFVVGYIDISEDKDAPYPYLSLWRLRFENGKYRSVYAGPFLNGSFYDAREFGVIQKRKAIFIKHVSCIECEPVVYLTAVDFNPRNTPMGR